MSGSSNVSGIVWFRQDLRLADNPALRAACSHCDVVIPLFIDDPLEQSVSQLGAASRVWLHHSLEQLGESLNRAGAKLILARGDSLAVLQQVIEYHGATRVYWNRCYDPATRRRDEKIKAALKRHKPESFNASLLIEPWKGLKKDGTPYRVFTPYWRAVSDRLAAASVLPAPRHIPSIGPSPGRKKNRHAKSACIAETLAELELLPDKPWHVDMMTHWQVGERAAKARLRKFLQEAVHRYQDARNVPGTEGTSRLSAHLHFGEISPRQIMHQLLDGREISSLGVGEEVFAKELVWREFAYSLLFNFPHTIDAPLDERFMRFPWLKSHKRALQAWQQGRTGVPIIDAGMRQLYASGWMHNRVRMVVASYLIKNLLIPWQAGERWFRDTLVDADLASNVMGWQWAAGSGADAAPFFRVFNPVLQGEKFDADGSYVRFWVPELAGLDQRFIHKPWELGPLERQTIDYPEPLVDLKQSRERALAAFNKIKSP